MAKQPRVATDDDGFQIASDAGDLNDPKDINEDDNDDDFDLLGEGDTSTAAAADEDDDDDVGDDDGGDDDDADVDDDGFQKSAVPPVARQKGKQTAQERIEELAAKRREAEAAAFKAEMAVIEERKRREELEARIAALESGKEKPSALRKPNPDDFKYGEVDTAYVEAMVEYRLSEERAKFQDERRTQDEQQENERKKAHYQARLAKVSEDGNKRFPDFDTIVNSVQFPSTVALDILDSDQGVDIAYYLGKNIGKLRELTHMTDAQRAKAIGRLEERFSARSSAGKKTSKAPDTPNRKSTRSGGKAGDTSKYGPENQDDFDRAFYGR